MLEDWNGRCGIIVVCKKITQTFLGNYVQNPYFDVKPEGVCMSGVVSSRFFCDVQVLCGIIHSGLIDFQTRKSVSIQYKG